MIKYDSNELKMMIQEIIIADFTQDFEKMYKTKAALFIRLDAMCEQIDDMQREISFLSGQLEAANNDLKKAYEEKAALEEQLHPWVDDESRLDPADYADLPFPDVEDMAPAEEVEGSDE